MRCLRELYAERLAMGRPVVSMEFFPPKTDEGERKFFEKTVPNLARLRPDYCSVTYGAGGTTRQKTLQIVDRIQREHGLVALAHLTCVGSTREQIREVAEQAKGMGIRNILALRGDPPADAAAWTKPEGGFGFAHELVTYLRQLGGFCVGVAGFPEGHVACREGKQVDWDRLKAKIDCGADFVVTQLFFDNRHYFKFRDYLQNAGVRVPLVPGIIPILSGHQIRKFTALCGAELPPPILQRLDELGEDDAAVAEFGIEHASRQCAELLAAGAPGVHFYTLNRARSTTRILQNLGLVAET